LQCVHLMPAPRVPELAHQTHFAVFPLPLHFVHVCVTMTMLSEPIRPVQ
jgi:hypothetical protein